MSRPEFVASFCLSKLLRTYLFQLICLCVFAGGLALPARGQFTVKLPGGLGRQIPGRQGSTFPRLGNSAKFCPTLGNWEAQLHQHYPQTNFMTILETQAESMAIPLFADDSFKPFFGNSYSSMSTAQLDAVLREKIQPCASGPARSQAELSVSVLIYAFNTHITSHPLSPARLVASLEQLKQVRAALAEQESQLRALPPAATSYQQATAIQTSNAASLRQVWPEESAAFTAAVQEALAASAAPALEQRLAPLLAAAPSQQNLAALRNFTQTNAELFKLLTPAQQQEFERRSGDAALRQGSTLLAQEEARSHRFRGDVAGLEEGASWYRSFESEWLASGRNPAAQAIADQYLRRRAAQLAVLEPELRRKLLASPAGQIQALSVFSLKADLETPAYTRLQKLAGSRQRAAAPAISPAAHAAGATSLRAAGGGVLTPASLVLAGTGNEKILTALYVGNFADVPFERDDSMFAVLIGNFMETYAKRCDNYLPRDKVEIMNTRCAETQTMVNRYSVPVGPTTCIDWVDDVHTNLYADPELYRAVHSASPSMASLLKGGATLMSGGLGGYETQLQVISDDNATLLEHNACNSNSLKRFQRNLELYATGRQPVRLDAPGGDSAATMDPQASSVAFTTSNFGKLLDDLVAAYSRNWLMNRYQRGSISSVQVSGRDAVGRPAVLAAQYRFTSGSPKVYEGTFTVRFSDGMPECMYFFDQPMKCQTPDRRIVEAYRTGAYQ